MNVFGYGSLVELANLQAFLGRRLEPDAYAAAELRDYRRVWNVAMDNRVVIPGYAKVFEEPGSGRRPDVRVTFLNVEPYPGSAVNGIVFRVDADELERIDRREWNYDLVDVTGFVATALPGRVLTSVAKPEAVARYERGRAEGKAVVQRAYHEGVVASFRALGEDAFARYRASTRPPDVPLVDLVKRIVH